MGEIFNRKMWVAVNVNGVVASDSLSYTKKGCIEKFMGNDNDRTWWEFERVIGWRCVRVMVVMNEFKQINICKKQNS